MRQREMAHIPTPVRTTTAYGMPATMRPVWREADEPGPERPGMVVLATITVLPHGHWPDCDRCKQSCESVYAGKPTCRRCSSNRRLNA